MVLYILALHRNGAGHRFGLGGGLLLCGLLLCGGFAAGGDQVSGSALPLGAVCSAGGGGGFAAGGLLAAAFCGGAACLAGCGLAGAGLCCRRFCPDGGFAPGIRGRRLGVCIRYNGLVLCTGDSLICRAGGTAGKEQRQRQQQQNNGFSRSLQNKKSLAIGRGQKGATIRAASTSFPTAQKCVCEQKPAAGVPTYDILTLRLLACAMACAEQNSITVMAVVTGLHRASDLIPSGNRSFFVFLQYSTFFSLGQHSCIKSSDLLY